MAPDSDPPAQTPLIQAAGILFQAKDGRILLVRRTAEGGDHGGEWSLPGGKVEEGETAQEAAAREAQEELGTNPAAIEGIGPLRLMARTRQDGVDWTTFRVSVPEPFDVTLNDEHDLADWVTLDNLPDDMHPGMQVVVDRIGMDELDVAQAVASGLLVSPQRYENMALVAMRITGTGAAYRAGEKKGDRTEFVWRPPDIYLNAHFLARCNGLPVIVEHPKGRILDSEEFAERIVGTILLPYVKQNEVWGVAKVFDASAIQMIEDHRLSTSPAVVFRDDTVNETETLDDGSTLLIEGKPSLLDHLAICENGVWDKGGTPTGIDSAINDGVIQVAGEGEDKDKSADEKDTKADDAGAVDQDDGKLDKLLAAADSIATRLDDIGGRVEKLEGGKGSDAAGEAAAGAASGGDKAMADEHEYPPEIASMPRETAADRMRFDMACAGYTAGQKSKADAAAAEEEAKKADRAKIDSDIAALKEKVDSIPKADAAGADEDPAAMADAQAAADSFYAQHASAAPRALRGETLLAYRRRLATGMKAHSPAWKGVDLATLPDEALAIAEGQIYADSAKAARNPVDLPDGQLRAIVQTDATGRRITSFAGKPAAWMAQFATVPRTLTGISNGSR